MNLIRNPRLILLFVLVALFSIQAASVEEENDPSRLTLERLFSSAEFRAKGFGNVRWIDAGAGYTALESSQEFPGARDLVRHATEDGSRTVLVEAGQLVPPGSESPLRVSDYAWSADGARLLVFTNTKRVWRYNTRGDYWVLDLDGSKLRKLGGDAEPSTLMFAKFSPGGDRVAYVRENNIYVEEIESGEIIALTEDGSKQIVNGTSDWVYEEEFSLRDGFRWSPDGLSIAYWQFDTEGIRDFYLINNTDDLYPRITPVQYPKAGTVNAACRAGVVSSRGGETRWLRVPGDPRNHYIARMEWAASSDEVVLQQLNRLQNTNTVMLGRIGTGEVRTVLKDVDDAWVDVVDDLKWLDGGKRFTWLSERDGWRRAYLVSRTGESVEPVTPCGYDAIEVVRIDDEGGWLYFIASPGNPTQRFLYRALLDGSGDVERITPKGHGGTHSYRISPDGSYAFHTSSSFGNPPQVELIRLPEHETVRVLEDNAGLRERIAALSRGESGFFRIAIDDVLDPAGDAIALDGWCIKPPGFDPARKYPLLFYVYGEPAGQTVLDRWGGDYYLWHLLLAQQGYVIMSVDNRGTPAPRGRAWRKCVYGKVGLLASREQAAAARAIMKRWPWIDETRIGTWGWSGGGSMSLNAVFRHPDLYRTAMAVATVSDQRLYDTIYMERYMGLPQESPENYRQGSPITFARQLQGNLLLVHGTGDDNCHYQGVERLINELVEHNKPFTMMAYPNRSHNIDEGKNTRRHLFELLTRYLNDNLAAGPR